MSHFTPANSMESPRFTGVRTFARLPNVTELTDVDLAVVGLPFDTGVTYRVGARFGPEAVRSASVMLRAYNPELKVKPFEVLSCVDYGDATVYPGFIHESYESIDVDFFDPAYAPGTGTPEVGGPTSFQGLQYLRARTGVNWIGGSVVEVLPAYDHAQLTAQIGAQVAYEFICLVALEKVKRTVRN